VNKKQLARIYTRVSRRSPARAHDEIDHLVYRMLKALKRPFIRSAAAGAIASKQVR